MDTFFLYLCTLSGENFRCKIYYIFIYSYIEHIAYLPSKISAMYLTTDEHESIYVKLSSLAYFKLDNHNIDCIYTSKKP